MAFERYPKDEQSPQKWALERLSYYFGLNDANDQNAAEIAELVEALHRVLAKSPAGSQYPFWIEERGKIADLLKKYEQ